MFHNDWNWSKSQIPSLPLIYNPQEHLTCIRLKSLEWSYMNIMFMLNFSMYVRMYVQYSLNMQNILSVSGIWEIFLFLWNYYSSQNWANSRETIN